jgi:hypothetical protein
MDERSPTTPPSGRAGKGIAPHGSKGKQKKALLGKCDQQDNSDLLWMYSREIAPFETPTFRDKVGELIARATSTSSETRLQSASENI